MHNRRDFLKSTLAAGLIGSSAESILAAAGSGTPPSAGTLTGNAERRYWIGLLDQLARPVLTHLARRELKQAMPVEASAPASRRKFTHLEAFGRLMCGIAPWLELTPAEGDESALQREYRELSQRGIAAAVDPDSPDFMEFRRGGQQ